MGFDNLVWAGRCALGDLWGWMCLNLTGNYLLAVSLVAVSLLLWKMIRPPA